MARGGKRPGAGRKVGALTKRTREIAADAIEGGISPLDYLMSLVRDESLPQEDRKDAAKAAAPYVHPRLNAVDHTSADGTMTPATTVGIYQLPDNGRDGAD